MVNVGVKKGLLSKAKFLGVLLLTFVLALPTMASAETVSVVAGTNTQTQTAVTFSAVNLDVLQNQVSTASNTITITDNRGNANGWSVLLAASNFVSGSLTDPTASGTYTVSIPASAVSVSLTSPTLVQGQAIHATHGPKVSGITLSNTPTAIVNASPGFGMGSYTTNATYTLTVPKTVTVASRSNASSKYAVGDTVGIVATTYTGTLTFTLGAGI